MAIFPAIAVSWLITIPKDVQYAGKVNNHGYIGFLGTFESIAGSYDLI